MLRTQLIIRSILLLVAVMIAQEAEGEPLFTAIYVFGDSLIDPGNNIYFNDSVAKADYYPYGIDFEGGTTGRFCNGKILVDFLAEVLGLPLLPSYANTRTKGESVLSGVNYASAGAGILEGTGHALGRVIPLSEQIANFNHTVNQLKHRMQGHDLSNYLAKALVFINMGANDYLNNYLQPLIYISGRIYSPRTYATLLRGLYHNYMMKLHSIGLRKFYLLEIPPLGCSPMVLQQRRHPKGKCDMKSNKLVQMFNAQLKSLVDQLNSKYPESIFSRGAAFQLFIDLHHNAHAYGFRVKDKACCGQGTMADKGMCLPNITPCSNRTEYLYWDSAHTTEAANRILIQQVYKNSSYNFPATIEQMAKM